MVEEDTQTICHNLVTEDSEHFSNSLPVAPFPFSSETELSTSRVYEKTRLYEPDASFTSSAVRTHAWSVLSGLSLTEVSMISVIALPLYSHDISNSQWYTFGEASQAVLESANSNVASSLSITSSLNTPLNPKNPNTALDGVYSGAGIALGWSQGSTLCCDAPNSGPWWCNACQFIFCDACWEKQYAHSSRTRNSGNHQKTNLALAKVIQSILHPETDSEEQRNLYCENYKTKWFGVIHELGSLSFRDFGQYGRLAVGMEGRDDMPLQYPSLSSFVGEAGAGKSTLISALIKVISLLFPHEVALC
jgi:hypothetical protein